MRREVEIEESVKDCDDTLEFFGYRQGASGVRATE